MMELKVWVEGIQRIVCGVTVTTTCQDVVFALAHATGKVGRFTLIERWRNNERLLAPNENPLKLLLKWGEYANDVQFILQRSESKQQQQPQQQQQAQQRFEATTTNVGSNGNSNGNNNNYNNNNNHIVNSDTKTAQTNAVMLKKPLVLSNNTTTTNNNNNTNNNSNTNYINNNNRSNNIQHKVEEFKKSFGAYDVKQNENIGIVHGVPQRPAVSTAPTQKQQHFTTTTNTTTLPAPTTSTTITPAVQFIPRHEKSHSNPIDMLSTSSSTNQTFPYASHAKQYFNLDNNNLSSNSSNSSHSQHSNNNNSNNYMHPQLGSQYSKSINEINLAVVRDSLDRRTSTNISQCADTLFINSNNHGNNLNNNNNNNSISSSNEHIIDIYNGNAKFNASPDLYKNAPAISANGALVPPPYRDPPPPRNSPTVQQVQQQRSQQDATPVPNTNLYDYNSFDIEFQNISNNNNAPETTPLNAGNTEESDSIFQATQYNDLLQLIKFQREKISAQQLELSKYDVEIVFLENKEREQAQELEAISREITKADQIFRQGSEQLQTLQYVEEENELVKQQEKTLKSEIALLRSKLANCETELLQCKNKIRLLMDDIEVEQRTISNKQKNNRQNVERDFLIEMERIQGEIDQAIHSTDTSNKTTENLKKEIQMIENAIAEKKRQVEQLVNEMKEVNLQSLTVTTSEEIKHLLEGSNKPGSSRRIIGSPRQLENAVPTSKNPHGVWV